MGQDPEELRAEIARTRAELGDDLDVLVEKVTPSKVVERKVDATKEAVVGVKEKIMGSASSAKESVMGSTSSATSSAGSSVSNAGHTVADVASQAPTAVKQKASGNPFAAGVVAFGLGWLVSSLLPASRVEQQGAEALKDAAQSVADPVKQGLASAANEVKDTLAPAAQEAVQAVKQEATDAASTVKEQAGQAQAEVKDQATTSAGTVKETASSAAQDAKQQATGSTPPPATADEPTVTVVVEEDVVPAPFPPDPTGPTAGDYTSGAVPPRPTI